MDLSKLPRWILAIALLMVAIGFLVSLYLLDEPRTFAGLDFGPKAVASSSTDQTRSLIPAIDYGDCEVKHTISDKSTMVECRAGNVVVGLGENRGHSSDYNEPHDFKCCKLIAK